MYRIALCDDEPLELEKTETLLKAYKMLHSDHDFTTQQFGSMDELLKKIWQTGSFDLLLLDVYMPEKTGIEGAKKLREEGAECPIIFLTTSLEHAVDAFEVDAVQYLVKPVEQARFFTAMDKAFGCMKEAQLRYIALRSEGELRRIALRDIIFCESHGNYQYITLVDGTEIRVRMTLSELHTLMSNSRDFVRVGVARLVNLSHVDSVSSKEILLDNRRKIGVPRGAYPSFKERYFAFYCSGRSHINDRI